MSPAVASVKKVLGACPGFVELPPRGPEVSFAGAVLSHPSPHLAVANLLLIFVEDSVPKSGMVITDEPAQEAIRIARERAYQVMSEVIAGGPLILSYITSLAPHLVRCLGLPRTPVPPVTPVTRSNKVVTFQVGGDHWVQFTVTAIIVTRCVVQPKCDAPFPVIKDRAAEIYLLPKPDDLQGLVTYLQARSTIVFQECPLNLGFSPKDVGGQLGRASCLAGMVIILASISAAVPFLFLPATMFPLVVGIICTWMPPIAFLLRKSGKVGGADDSSHLKFARTTSWPHFLEESRLEARGIVQLAQKLAEPAHRRQLIIEALDSATAAEILPALDRNSAT